MCGYLIELMPGMSRYARLESLFIDCPCVLWLSQRACLIVKLTVTIIWAILYLPDRFPIRFTAHDHFTDKETMQVYYATKHASQSLLLEYVMERFNNDKCRRDSLFLQAARDVSK